MPRRPPFLPDLPPRAMRVAGRRRSSRAGHCWLAALMLLALGGCEHQSASSAAEAEAAAERAPAQTSRDVRFGVYDGDRPRAEILAALMEQYETEDSTYTLLHSAPEQQDEEGRVTAYLFDEAGDSSAVIRADRLVYYEEESRFEARGRVIVTTAEGKRLEGEHLAWDEAARRVHTPGFVRITTPSDRVQGYGLDANEDLSDYRLANVTGETTVEDS